MLISFERAGSLSYISIQLQGNCSIGHFRCTNGRCVSKTQVCNGVDDCLDNSDEVTDCKSDIKISKQSYPDLRILNSIT